MLTVTPTFLETIRLSHTYAFSATVYPPNASPFDLDVEDGTVTIDRTAAQRRQLSLTVSDPGFYPKSPSDPLNVYGTEIIPRRGIRYGDGTEELVSLGVFRIQDAQLDEPGGTLTIDAFDRSMQIADERFLKPKRYDEMPGVALIQSLITGVYPDAVFSVTASNNDTIKKHVVDLDRWAEVQRVAGVLGAEVFPDENGVWVIQDIPTLSDTPVWTVNAGPGGVLVSNTNMVTRDQVPSVIVATGPSSPTTYAADAFGGSRPTGWAKADIGGSWQYLTGAAGDFDIAGNRGEVSAAQGDTKKASLTINEADVDATVTARFQDSGTSMGGDLQSALGVRATTATNYLRVNLTLDNATGHVTAVPEKVVSGSATNLGSGKGLGSVGTNAGINLRIRIKGTSFKAKAWLDSGSEPRSWDWDTTQSAITGNGDVLVVANRGSANTTSGPQFSYDSLKATALTTLWAAAYDNDPTSPTYYKGSYGTVPFFVNNPLARTQAQIDRVAARELANHIGASRSVSFNSVPNPALDAGDVVTIIDDNGVTENHLISYITIPLSPTGTLAGETRASNWTAT